MREDWQHLTTREDNHLIS